LIPDRLPAQNLLSEPDDSLDFAEGSELVAARPHSCRDLFVLRGGAPEGKRPEPVSGRDFLDLAAVSAADWTAVLAERPSGDNDAVVILVEDTLRKS
jgi:hypothetical protein